MVGGGGREGRGGEGMEEGVRGMWGLGWCVVRLILCWVLGEREWCAKYCACALQQVLWNRITVLRCIVALRKVTCIEDKVIPTEILIILI